MADISKINVVQDYNIKDRVARQNQINKNQNDNVPGIPNFLNGIKINGNSIIVHENEVLFDDSTVWNFDGASLKSNGFAVVTVDQVNPSDLVGQKYKVNNVVKGEIVGDYENNIAAENYSFVTGRGNISNYATQLIGGKYNDNKNTSLFEIGNGTSTSNRSNAFEVKADGTAVCNDVQTSGFSSLVAEIGKNTKRRITNNSAITVTTSNTTLLNESLQSTTTAQSYCIGSIPITMATDGNVIVTLTTNLTTVTVKKYCLKGSDLLDFIFTLASGTNSIKIEIKTEYFLSDMKNIQAQIASLTNYIMTLSYAAPTPDTTLPQGTIAASGIDIILIGI